REEIVGQIADEHDAQDVAIRVQADGSVNVDGTVAVRDLNRQMDWSLPDDEATTIAGLVIHEAQTIPEPGQAFTFYGYRFEILRKSRNKITAIRARRTGAAAKGVRPSHAGGGVGAGRQQPRAPSAAYSFIVHVIGAIMPTSGQSTKTDAWPTSRPQGGASRGTWLCAAGVLAR